MLSTGCAPTAPAKPPETGLWRRVSAGTWRATASNPQPLEAGMVFTVEPGIYLTGRFGRLEEVVVVTVEGAEVLSKLPRTLHAT